MGGKIMLQEKTYHVIAQQETGLIKAYGIAEAKEKAFHFFQACYGNDYNILNIVDITSRNISAVEYLKNRLV
jgi:hypothetical protein